MAYIGRSPEYGNAVSQQITGTNSVGPYTLSYDTSTSGVVISLDGVVQRNSVDFNIVGTALTFTSTVGTGIIINVVFTGLTLSFPTPSDGSVTNAKTNFQPGTTFKGDGSSADGKITLNCSQNSHGVSIQSPAHSANASYTLTLPVNDGDADQALKTNGSGVLSWGTAGGPSLGTDAVIRTNAKTIAENITFAGTENGMSAGPVTINSGYTVTVTSGSTWTIV